GPSRDWLNPELNYLKTNHAREKVRQWFKKRERAENIERGREVLEKELRRLGVSLAAKQAEILRLYHLDSTEELFARVGTGDLSTHQIATRLASALEAQQEPLLPPPVTSSRRVIAPHAPPLVPEHMLASIALGSAPVPARQL